MTRPTRFGVTLPQIKRTWEEASATARELDDLGYDSLWVCDHLYGVPLPNLPILEGWTQLAAVAAITCRAKLGTLVTPPFFRNPAVLAKQIATIDQIAPGRVIAGMGAGWFPPEFEQLGLPFPGTGARLRALEECVEIMKRLWTEEKATFEGEFFQVKDAMSEPKPASPPEIRKRSASAWTATRPSSGRSCARRSGPSTRSSLGWGECYWSRRMRRRRRRPAGPTETA